MHRPKTVAAPYYEETVRQWLEERFGKKLLYEGGLTVHTACDPAMTAAAKRGHQASGLAQLTRRQGYFGPLKRLARRSWTRPRPSRWAGRPGAREPSAEAVVTAVDQNRQRAELRLGAGPGLPKL